MNHFENQSKQLWDPFGDWDWESPFGLSLFGRRSPFSRTFEELDRVFELAEKGELPPAGENGPFIFASSTYVGPDGVPRHRQVKNFEGDFPAKGLLGRLPFTGGLLGRLGLGSGRKALPEGSATPHYEVRTGEKELTVTVDLPGLTKQDIEVETTESTLHLKGRAEGAKRSYALDLELPKPVKPGKAKAAFTNGILDLTLPLARPAEAGRKIKIE